MKKAIRIIVLGLCSLASIYAATVNENQTVNGKILVTGQPGVGADGSFRIDTDFPSVSNSGSNYHQLSVVNNPNYNISSGVTDNGYRVGTAVHMFASSSNFEGTLYRQVGAWLRVGHYNHATNGNPTGRINNSIALWLENLGTGSTQVDNAYGVYQTASFAKNYFAGKVGIGTTSPSARLHVVGDIYFQNEDKTGSLGYDKSLKRVKLSVPNSGSSGNKIQFQLGGWSTDAVEVVRNTGEVYHRFSAVADSFLAAEGGNVGIGTTTPNNKLEVNGTIRAKEVIVETANWPDYVFEDGYDLPSLDAVEAHIDEHGNLPGIPSAIDAESKGVSLGDSQRMLLQKMEEMTLYMIDQNKRLDKKDAIIVDLLNRIEKLETAQ
ncbi:hypothetical protein MLD52_15265 [Puniceicoccaceae bacterium K14]|nr:hypothetical protein [Puniceicoccaceae bacterium K14]